MVLDPSRTEWNERRKQKVEAKVDSRVLAAISNYELWTGQRPITGAGIPVVQAQEIAEALNFDLDTVADSLERLRWRSLIHKDDGTVPSTGGTSQDEIIRERGKTWVNLFCKLVAHPVAHIWSSRPQLIEHIGQATRFSI